MSKHKFVFICDVVVLLILAMFGIIIAPPSILVAYVYYFYLFVIGAIALYSGAKWYIYGN